jgi:hypothetical protein
MKATVIRLKRETAETIAVEARERGLSITEYLETLTPQHQGTNLRGRGIDEIQAADLGDRLKTFTEDWNRPEADIYDEDPPR